MSGQQALPKDHPTLVAFDRYKETDEYANTKRWANDPRHVDGSLWAAFDEGWRANSVLTPVVHEIASERQRQVLEEGWTPEHDDQHTGCEMAIASACYALTEDSGIPQTYWPWDKSWWKPRNYRRDLVRAAALLVAEIQRIDRADS